MVELSRIRHSDKVEDTKTDTELQQVESDRMHLLQRVNSLEDKDARLRDRLQQVEEHEQTQEAQLENLKEKLRLTEDKNSCQEQTILDLQQQISEQGSSDERKQQDSKVAELEKKYSNIKLLLSHKMDELDFSRKSVSSLEKSLSELQEKSAEMEELQCVLQSVREELALTKDINTSQEDTIKQLQSSADTDTDLTQSYHEQLTHQLSSEDVEEMQLEYQKETSQLRQEIDQLNQQLEKLSEQHQQQLRSDAAKISNLEKDVAKATSKLQIAQNLIEELKSQNRKLAHEGKTDYEDKIKDLNMKLQGEKVQNSVHRDVIASMSPQIEKLKCENESLEGTINSLKERFLHSEAEVAKRKAEVESLKARSNSLEKKLEESREVIENFQSSEPVYSELTELRQKLDSKSSESDNLAVDLIELTGKCEELKKHVELVTEKLEASRAEKNQLQNLCETMEKDMKCAQEAKANLQTQLASSKVEMLQVQQNSDDLNKKYCKEMKNAESLQALLKKRDKDFEQKELCERKNIAELQALVVMAAKDLQQVEGEKEVVIQSLDAAHSEVASLQNVKKLLEQELDQSNETVSKQHVRIASLKDQVANLDSELNRTSGLNETMLVSLKNQIYGLTQEKSALQSRNDKLVAEVDTVLSEKQVYIDEIEKLTLELKRCKSSYDEELTNQRKVTDELKKRLDEAYKNLQTKHVVDEQSHSSAEPEMSQKIDLLSKINSELQDELSSVRMKLADASDDRDLMQKRLNDEISSDLRTKFAELSEERNRQAESITELTKVAEQTQLANQELELQISDEQARNHVLLQQSKTFAAELAELKQSAEEERNKSIFLGNKQADKHKSEIAALQEMLSDICSERDELKKQAALSKASSERTLEVSNLRAQLEAVQKDNEQLKLNVFALENEQLDQLSSSSAETCILQAQVDNMREVVEKAKKEVKLKEQLKSLSTELQTQLRDERAAHSVTANELKVIKTEQMTFKEQVEDLKEKHEHCQQRCEELQASVQLLEQQLNSKCSENDLISSQLEKASTEHQNAVNASADMATELEKLNILLSEKATDCRNAQIRFEMLQGQLKTEEAKVKELSDLLSSAHSEAEIATHDSLTADDVGVLKSQLHNQKAVCDLAKRAVSLQSRPDSNSSSEEQPDNEDNYVNALQDEIRMLSNQLDSTKRENDDLSANLSDLDAQLSFASSYKNEAERLHKQKSDIEVSFEDLKQTLTGAVDRCNQLSLDLEVAHSSKALLEAKLDSADLDISKLKEHLESSKEELKQALGSKEDMKVKISVLHAEKDALATELKATKDTGVDKSEELTSLQDKVFELQQKLKAETKLKQNLEKAKGKLDESLLAEKQELEKSEMEVEKLQTSISLLMDSHETEMSSLQTVLHDTDSKMKELEMKVVEHSSWSNKLNSIVVQLNRELHSLKMSKEAVCHLVTDLVNQNTADSASFQQQLLGMLQSHKLTNGLDSSHNSPLPVDSPVENTSADIDTLPISSSPVPNPVSSTELSSLKNEPLLLVSHYSDLSKSDLVAKLSDQTKHELVLRKHLEEARQSLSFYRSAIDNIIDCLGTAMPSVKKWANDVLNLDALISNESALERRCNALEISEKALAENFKTKEQEYQLAIHTLEDRVSILNTSNAKLTEELKQRTTDISSTAEQQIANLKQEVSELEANIRKLNIQNEEIQFAYEQECERRQVEEEERCRADQRSRLGAIETVRESEYLAKIASLETKISGLLNIQNELEGKLENMKHKSEEEELRQRIATVERSERALLRKIEILQQSDNKGSAQYDNSLDQPEDLLRQKIWEMEKMEVHFKQQVSDLEHDREELHEIARSDKNTIHELNIQLAELTLSNKNLKAQLARVEQAEEIVCTKLDTAEVHINDLEEKLKKALDNEKMMRLQLTDVEYSEDSLRFHTDTVERSLDTLQASETLLKSTIADLTEERQRVQIEAATWKSRFDDLDTELRTVKGQLVETKNREITLKGKVSEFAATEASLRTRVKEVELQNEAFKNEVMHLKKSATGIRDSLSDSLFGKDELNNTIQDLRSTNEHTKSRLSQVETEKFEMEKRLQDVNIKCAQLQAQLNSGQTGNPKFSEKLASAVASERIARDAVIRLEAVVAAYENKQTSGVIERENFQLNAENKNLKDKLKTKERDARELEEKVNRLTAAGNTGGTYRINKLQEQVKDLQLELEHSKQTKLGLEEMLQKITSGSKASCGHSAEIAAMREELKRLKAAKEVPVHRYADKPTNRATHKSPKKTNATPSVEGESVRAQCLKELVDKVNARNTSITEESSEPPAVNLAVSDDEAAEIASQSSIWEKLEPPVRQSPRPVMSAQFKPSSPPPQPALAAQSRSSSPTEPDNSSDVPEESSLWEKLELVAPKKSITQPPTQSQIVFDDEPIAPVYCRSVEQGNDSADEASELEELIVPALEGAPQHSPSGSSTVGKTETGKHQSPTSLAQPGHAMDTKDIARLRQSVVDLERRLASRETEIRMLRNKEKEIERESSLSGDKYTMKTKLRTLQDQVDFGEKKIVELREEIITRDKNLTNRQREIIDLRLELSKLREESSAKSKVEEVVSPALSPHSAQRPIQMCTAPGRQTTVEQDPALLYKSMIESKDCHVEQLTKRLEEKTSDLERLEKELRSLRLEMPAAQDSRFKYLDDRYTETATKCYQMKRERDEWKAKYDKLTEEHSKCEVRSPEKCQKCKRLKSEIRRLQKELRLYKDRLIDKQLLEQQLPNRSTRRDEDEFSDSTIDGVTSLSTDPVIDHRSREQTSFRPYTNGINSKSLPVSSSNHRSSRVKPFEAQHYETISEYNPRYFSTSGREGQETPLKQGQIVKVLEQADAKGYARAEVNGRIYLVPMKYLQLLDISKSASSEKAAVLSQVFAPTQTPAYHTRSLTAHFPAASQSLESQLGSRRTRSASPTKYSIPSAAPVDNEVNRITTASVQAKLLRKPRAPTELRAEVIANQKLYVEWAYLHHLEHGTKSNGTPVLGFRVFLNGRSVKDIDSVYTTVTSLNLSRDQLSDLHTVSVQALGANNVNSHLVHISLSPTTDRSQLSPRQQSKESRTSDSKKATKRLFIANYDYDPLKHGSSGHNHSPRVARLALKTGDYIVTYGQPKPNGFYFAEVNGKTGYVPEAFIRQVPIENAKRFGFLDNDAYLRS
ncbi:golgin subfamily A member 4-like [Watersipora subatra]|uniref:golgin subfamily A member 4-like n=1 Tax=Watersipora subatra TaxID=2589382 RepID=UPI00355B6329